MNPQTAEPQVECCCLHCNAQMDELREKASAACSAGAHAEAAALCTQALDLFPNAASVALERARYHLNGGNPAAAVGNLAHTCMRS